MGSLIYSKNNDMAAHEFMLYCIVRGIRPKSILEIGIRSGVSTMAMCNAIIDECLKVDYHCCDINERSKAVQKKTSVPLIFHIMQSDDLAQKWSKQIDILFIDGDHEYQQVKRDYFNFREFVNPNGFIFLHDTYPSSEKYKSENYCRDAYKILEDLKKDDTVEFVTFPYSNGLTVVRKLGEDERVW